jgi:hypothetical protein
VTAVDHLRRNYSSKRSSLSASRRGTRALVNRPRLVVTPDGDDPSSQMVSGVTCRPIWSRPPGGC